MSSEHRTQLATGGASNKAMNPLVAAARRPRVMAGVGPAGAGRAVAFRLV